MWFIFKEPANAARILLENCSAYQNYSVNNNTVPANGNLSSGDNIVNVEFVKKSTVQVVMQAMFDLFNVLRAEGSVPKNIFFHKCQAIKNEKTLIEYCTTLHNMARMSGAGGQWGQRADPRPGEPRRRRHVPVL